MNGEVPTPVSPATPPEETCPHSGLKVSFLKKVGHAVKKVGLETVEGALQTALSGLGAFSDE